MAVLTAKGISKLAVELLYRKLVIPRTVSMVPGNEFMGPNGGTITVRVPQPGVARTQAARGDALVADDVTEIPVDVSLGHLYHLKNLTDQESSYELEDFGRQVTLNQVNAVAIAAEDKVLSVMNALPTSGVTYEFDISPTGTDEAETRRVLLAARKALSDAKCPPGDRWLACGSTVYNRILALLTPTGTLPDLGTDALREAIAGRIYGFNVFEAVGMDADEAVAYHKSAFAFAVRAPQIPRGAVESFVTNEQGIAIRQIFQYDTGHAQDQSLVSTFAGAAAIYEDGTGTDGTVAKRWVKLKLSAA